jgi:hypothetical protein
MRKSMPQATSLGMDTLRQIVLAEELEMGREYFGLVMG